MVRNSMISDYRDLADYILKNYRGKVVEVGVGSRPEVALLLKEGMDVIVTDISEQKYAGLRFCRDDIFAPDMDIYKDSALIYSIRPPIDIQEAIAKTARDVGADLLIRPFGNEKADLRGVYRNCKLLNYNSTRFYLYKAEQRGSCDN